MEKIEFLAVSAPIWALLLSGVSGFLVFVRFSFGSLSRKANLLLLLMLFCSLMSCTSSASLGEALASFLLPGALVFLLLWLADYALLCYSRREDRRCGLRSREAASDHEVPSSEYL